MELFRSKSEQEKRLIYLIAERKRLEKKMFDAAAQRKKLIDDAKTKSRRVNAEYLEVINELDSSFGVKS